MRENTVMINNELIHVKKYQGQNVVTFRDIDQCHKRTSGTARKRFNDNKRHFLEGIDFFKISASEFRTRLDPGLSVKAAEDITIFTETGYLMLVKSFTDDLAWQVQRQLVNGYFRLDDSEAEELLRQQREQERLAIVETKNMMKEMEAVQKLLLDQGKSELELLQKGFQDMRNAQIKIYRMLYAYTNDHREWKERIYRYAKEISAAHPDQYETPRKVLSELYIVLRNSYGFVLEQEMKEYRKKHPEINGKVSTIDLVAENNTFRDIYGNLMKDKYDEMVKVASSSLDRSDIEKIPVVPVVIEESVKEELIKPELTPLERFESSVDLVLPFFKSRNVASRKINERMLSHRQWQHRIGRYQNIHEMKKRPTPKQLILNDEKLLKLHKKLSL